MEKLIIIREAFNLFFDESDEEEDYLQHRITKIENYAEEVVPRFDSKIFKQHFRMLPNVFQAICLDIRALGCQEYVAGRNPLRIEKKLMITLWYLGNQECLRSIADRFGVSISTSWRVISDMCDAVTKLNRRNKIIKWPTSEEAAKTSAYYMNKYKFMGIIGSIDGSHIPIRAPINSHNSYINRKGFHSVLLQGVCNEKMEFLYCYTGECGSIHDAALMAKSGLENRIRTGNFPIGPDQHLLGDSAYPLKQWLIPPFRDNGHLRDEQKIFNTVHSKCRVAIERAFGLLKGRFRRLFYIDCLRPAAIVRFIIASCILHNICLQNEDLAEEYVVDDFEGNDESESNNELSEISSASSKRDRLLNALF